MKKIHLTLTLLAATFLIAPAFAQTAPAPTPSEIAAGGNAPTGFDMAPETNITVVNAARANIKTPIPPGPFQPTWASLEQNYKVPTWFAQAKFGIFMHWGLYAVPAQHNEWYEQYMYGAGLAWHTQNFGPPETFGYKDFIPKFTAAKWDPDAWAALFQKAGAKFVIPTAQHHDNFSLWDSKANPINAKNLGPKRDLIADLAKAVRAKGLKFGVSNHGIEAFQFIHLSSTNAAALKAKNADVFDPQWADWYHVADRSDAACQKFLENWIARNVELIDQYQPDLLWFDNGVDQRYLDPLKLWVAAYYYNRAAAWGKEVSISTKKAAYAPGGDNIHTIGSIIDFEKIGARSPAGIRGGVWEVDDPIGSTWGYTTAMTVSKPDGVVSRLIDTASKNGTYLLNISPMADGTIPQAQIDTLLEVGKWLEVNGEAIYGTHSWTRFSDSDDPNIAVRQRSNVRFTVKGDDLYAIITGRWPGETFTLKTPAAGGVTNGKITSVTMLGNKGNLEFSRGEDYLNVTLPAAAPCKYAYVLKITGLKMNPSPVTKSGNPE